MMKNIPLTKQDTRDQLLDEAQRFIQSHSYDGFSFRELAETVGIRKASIYHHFPSKEALTVAMLQRAREGFLRWAQAHAGLPPIKQLEAYCFDLYRDRLGAGMRLCPAGAFAASWDHLPDDIRTAARNLIREQRRFLSTAIEASRADASLKPDQQPTDDLAEWLIAAVQGALVSARAFADDPEQAKSVFTRLCQQTLDQLIA